MIYTIIGKGGQGVLFLAKTLAQALLLSNIEDFSFLKEFDEGQRNGEIKITFNLPFDKEDKEIIIKENNIIELKKLAKKLNIDEENIKKALQEIKPKSFEKNWKIYNDN